MIKVEGFLVLVSLALVLYSFIDCARREDYEIKKLPKWGWLLIIFFTGTFGAIAFLVIGRTPRNGGGGKSPKKRILPPDDDPDFLRSI
ncbi:MAG: hypothetical protein RLZ23_815 [Actinomycetota bacterium]|jgi:hypothetical protein